MTNQTPEQKARDEIDRKLVTAGWVVQSKNKVDLSAGTGVAVREYLTDVGPADYVLFADGKPVGVIEAKREEEGERLTVHEDQAAFYAKATLKYNLNEEPLPFVYESTGGLTRFTDYRDPKPRSRPVFHFHKPETLAKSPDSNGHRRGQNLYRLHFCLSVVETRQCPAHPVSGGHPQPGRTGRAGVFKISTPRRQPQIHRAL